MTNFFARLLVVILAWIVLSAGTLLAQDAPVPGALDKDQARKALWQELHSGVNTVVVETKDGRRFEGTITVENASGLSLRQVFGKSGVMETRIARADIAQVKSLDQDFSPITDAEVELKSKFPRFNFIRRRGYTFFSDEDYFRVSEVAALLQRLRRDVEANFASLVSAPADRRIYVVVFGDPRQFNDYCAKAAPYLKGAAGFYDPVNSQLVVYDFFHGAPFQEFNATVGSWQADLERRRRATEDHRVRESINNAMSSLADQSARYAGEVKAQNISVVRHEGGHQLSYDLGILKVTNCDIWLAEGFAEFCSMTYLGEKKTESLALVKAALQKNIYIPLERLFALSDNTEFYQQERDQARLAYAESWVYFYYLMRPGYREGFFRYLNALRSGVFVPAAARQKFFEVQTGITTRDLDKRVKALVLGNPA